MNENAISTAGPATHPICAIAHASDNTPDPITAVIMCALAVTHVPTHAKIPVNLLLKVCVTNRLYIQYENIKTYTIYDQVPS